MDLTFRMSGNKVSPDLIETRASRFNVLPDTSDCASRLNAIHDNRADGYWVIGDAPMVSRIPTFKNTFAHSCRRMLCQWIVGVRFCSSKAKNSLLSIWITSLKSLRVLGKK